MLPGRVLPARVESIGWGVGEGDVDPTTGLPKTHQGSGGWFAPAQRFPVQLAFETADRATTRRALQCARQRHPLHGRAPGRECARLALDPADLRC